MSVADETVRLLRDQALALERLAEESTSNGLMLLPDGSIVRIGAINQALFFHADPVEGTQDALHIFGAYNVGSAILVGADARALYAELRNCARQLTDPETN